jgi:hypothetical protein
LTYSDEATGPWTHRSCTLVFCAMQQSIGAMRQLSVIIMVYQRISACNERLSPHGCRFIET